MSPEAKLVQDKHFIREKVKEKYQDTAVSPLRVRQWGNNAAVGLERRTVGRQFNFIIDSLRDFSALCQALEVPDLSYDGDSIRESELAVNAVASYMVTLRSFVGANRQDGQKRQWLQPRWVKKIAEAQEWASGRINAMTNHDLEAWYDEAFYNAWSREQYWQAWDQAHRERRHIIAHTEPKYVPIPIEAYENDPENLMPSDEAMDY